MTIFRDWHGVAFDWFRENFYLWKKVTRDKFSLFLRGEGWIFKIPESLLYCRARKINDNSFFFFASVLPLQRLIKRIQLNENFKSPNTQWNEKYFRVICNKLVHKESWSGRRFAPLLFVKAINVEYIHC